MSGAPENPSHADILAEVRGYRSELTTYVLAQQRDAAASKATADALARIEASIGWCKLDEHGLLIGEGLCGEVGRLKERVDKRFQLYDGMERFVKGSLAAALVAGAIIWWLIAERLGFLR